ncbi:uncharacterized protein LOC132716825 isoform X2 [Ruditapes philippinarum]|uniref:uncharacterized protein LOC132716825 isoform X2 n=1 Tax=Ruditapes philippinarum TaxID=129788 RepID=UPI00295AD5A8|nr:uncharacterized protein LOC132716825 isoform X2 [Ruditapes philippinarum]XP_060556167.1 uncharacterized protein LOC132716825 isoform X2 [Ruditapes philippinarum]
MSRKLEREMRLGTITSRRSLMEREKAMEAARNPGVSKFGDCLVNINLKDDKTLNSNLRKINSEIRRMQLQFNHKMKYFVKRSNVLNHDPIILVERPPSPEVKKRAHLMEEYTGEDDVPGDENKPGYMKQIRSKARTPSTLTTIDAFTVKQRKKKNVWEDAVEEKSRPEFESTVRPFAKLTSRERSDLQKGYEFHKPKLENSGNSEPGSREASPHRKKISTVSDDSDFEDEITPFITQMAEVRNKGRDRKEKTVAEISLRAKTPLFEKRAAGSQSNKTLTVERMVRFKSPVMSAPKARNANRKLKTKATEIVY